MHYCSINLESFCRKNSTDIQLVPDYVILLMGSLLNKQGKEAGNICVKSYSLLVHYLIYVINVGHSQYKSCEFNKQQCIISSISCSSTSWSYLIAGLDYGPDHWTWLLDWTTWLISGLNFKLNLCVPHDLHPVRLLWNKRWHKTVGVLCPRESEWWIVIVYSKASLRPSIVLHGYIQQHHG